MYEQDKDEDLRPVINQYHVCWAAKLDDLIKEVDVAIEAGWQPFGNLVVQDFPDTERTHFYQPMVMYVLE
jgi:hypothetical protein